MQRSHSLMRAGVAGFFLLLGSIVALVVFQYLGTIDDTIATSAMTALLVVITGGYAAATYLLVVETRRTREQEIRPVLEFHAAEYGARIANVGTGPARNVTVTLELQPVGISQRVSAQYLPPGESLKVFEEPFTSLRDREYLDLQLEYVPAEELPEEGENEDEFFEELEPSCEHLVMTWSCEDIWGNSRNGDSAYSVYRLVEGIVDYRDHTPNESLWMTVLAQELSEIRLLLDEYLRDSET